MKESWERSCAFQIPVSVLEDGVQTKRRSTGSKTSRRDCSFIEARRVGGEEAPDRAVGGDVENQAGLTR